jgi:hypothetical protein
MTRDELPEQYEVNRPELPVEEWGYTGHRATALLATKETGPVISQLQESTSEAANPGQEPSLAIRSSIGDLATRKTFGSEAMDQPTQEQNWKTVERPTLRDALIFIKRLNGLPSYGSLPASLIAKIDSIVTDWTGTQ